MQASRANGEPRRTAGHDLLQSYCNLLGEQALYGGGGLVSHAEQDVGVSVEGYGSCGVTQKLLDELGVHPLLHIQRGAGVPEIVKAQIWQARAPQERLEAAGNEVLAGYGDADTGRKTSP
jgi:hypothetical protein